jgi:L-lactate dehydrogenase complex protein LldG
MAGEPPTEEGPGALIEQFRTRAEPLGVRVFTVQSLVEAAGDLASLAAEWNAESVVASQQVLDAAPSLPDHLASLGISTSVADAPGDTRDAPLGLAFAHAALAETGSVLVAEDSLADRSVGMLTASIAFVCSTRTLLSGLDDAAPILREIALRGGGRFATLITGPSRTADIERVLTVGVQGPGRVAVFFVDELP